MKQNPCPVVGEVTKATGIGLDELDSTVESFGAGVADSVLAKLSSPCSWCLSIFTTFLTGSNLLRIALFDQTLKKRLAAPL